MKAKRIRELTGTTSGPLAKLIHCDVSGFRGLDKDNKLLKLTYVKLAYYCYLFFIVVVEE